MITIGTHKMKNGRPAVVSEIYGSNAYGRIFTKDAVWVAASWDQKSGTCLSRIGSEWNIPISPKPRMIAYYVETFDMALIGAKVVMMPEDKVVTNDSWKRAPWLDEPEE